MQIQTQPTTEPDFAEDDDIVQQLIEAIRNVHGGQVQITIQDSGVLKVRKTEEVKAPRIA